MKRALGVERDQDLAAELGMTGSAIGKWRERGSVPLEAVLAVAGKLGLSIDWLIHGDLDRSAGALLEEGGNVIAGLFRRKPTLVRRRVLAVAVERAAQEWAAFHQGGDMVVFDLGDRAARLYSDYLLAIANQPELDEAVLDVMATVLRPHLHWRLAEPEADEGGGNPREVETEK